MHRIYFHWGYYSKPQTSKGLVRYLKKFEKNNNETDAVYRYIGSLWKKRKPIILRDLNIINFMGKKEKEAFAVILYDIHILSDFSSDKREQIDNIMPIKSIEYEITDKGLMPLLGKTSLISEIKAISRSDSCIWTAERRKAQKILNLLIEKLPNELSQKYGPEFNAHLGVSINTDDYKKLENWSLVSAY
jgi:hypothetical protein